MTTDSYADSIELTREAISGSKRASNKRIPLLRTESSDAADDQLTEVPIPLAKLRDPQSITVLHVDDDPQIGDLVATFLERVSDDISVVTESNAVAALDRLGDGSIDCIVSDYQMPNTDGLELLEIIRERYPDMPFILFTGQGSEEIASEAIAAGVTDYMQKGTGTDQYEVLANRVENAVDQYRTEQQFWNALSWYQRLVEQELTGVCIVQNEAFVYVNQRLANTFGYDQCDLVDSGPEKILSPDAREEFFDLIRSTDDDGCSFEATLTGVTADGDHLSIEVSGGAIEYDSDPAWIGVLRTVDDD